MIKLTPALFSLRQLVQAFDSKRSIGAAWFSLISLASWFFLSRAYQEAGDTWRKYEGGTGGHGVFLEMVTTLTIASTVYFYRYVVFPSSNRLARNLNILRVSFVSFAVFIPIYHVAFSQFFVYPLGNPQHIPPQHLWYGSYMFLVLCLVSPLGAEICGSIFLYEKKKLEEMHKELT